MRRILLITLAAAGWFALMSQLFLALENSQYSTITTIVNFFSYFTILTNLLVAICSTALLLSKHSFLTREKSQAAIAVYIFIVGLVYNIALRHVWNPTGLQKVTDELLHTAIPIMFLIYWIAFAPKDHIRWSDVFLWLIYPLIYSIYTLIRGLIIDWYPYPFIDPNSIGWNQVGINSAIILLAFLLISLILIALSVAIKPRRVA